MPNLISVLVALLLSSVVVCSSYSGSGIAAQKGSGCAGSAPCQQCHQQVVVGIHSQLACADCHHPMGSIEPSGAHGAELRVGVNAFSDPSGMASGAAGCVHCHLDSAHIFKQAMTQRSAEQEFCQRSWGRADPQFFATNCISCHVTNCLDCHGGSEGGATAGHDIQRPTSDDCYACHKGYFVGWDFAGRAPREDSLRYQRGPQANGEHYLKMRPDVHAEAGMQCGDCHTMQSLQRGEKSAKSCGDCHVPDPQVIEHSISAHLTKMECASCHAAWAAQDYATFYIRTVESTNREYFRVKPINDQYIKSSYLKRQDEPPLGLNSAGRMAPIRPQFMAYYSEMNNNEPVGAENRLMLAQWKAFTPHTIRRGSVMCNGCHDNARRFMLQPLDQRKYRPDLDGLQLESFWRSDGQVVANGAFYTAEQFAVLSKKSLEYSRKYAEKWQNFLKIDADSCAQ